MKRERKNTNDKFKNEKKVKKIEKAIII